MPKQRIIPVTCPQCSLHFEIDTFALRFWALVDQTGGPEACWPWMGNISPNGYGMVTVNAQFEPGTRSMGAHRVAYILGNGPLSHGLHACHTCDFRPCCNPAHLFAGTVTENMRDMVAKGRQGKKAQSFCKRGHDQSDPENQLRWFDDARQRWRVRCRACNTVNTANWRESLSPDQRADYLEQVRRGSRAWHVAHPGYIQPSRRKAKVDDSM